MRKIAISRYFPATHPRKGEPTYFPQKILASMDFTPEDLAGYPVLEAMPNDNTRAKQKIHTVRTSNRLKAGEWVQPFFWEARPYRSRQIDFMPPVQIIWKLPILKEGVRLFLGSEKIERPVRYVAHKDGLEVSDWMAWFPEKYEGFIYYFSFPE